MSALPLLWPHAMLKFESTWVNRLTSTPSKTPSRTKKALEPSCSSAMPGQMSRVPERLSRSMISFTAKAATMFTACPELCPSPCPGAMERIGSRYPTPGF